MLVTLVPLKQDYVGDIKGLIIVLQAAVGFVLLIACVNVANLLLSQAGVRAREFTIRKALGATSGRIVTQLLSESILLALLGGALGILVAFLGTKAALAAFPDALPRAEAIHLDWRVLSFTLFASMLTGVLFGMAPAVRASRLNLQGTLREGGHGSTDSRNRTRSVFLAIEMALALVLLSGAGLMIRSLANLWRVDPGFDAHDVLTARVSIPAMSSPDSVRAMWGEINQRVSLLPGVKAASLSLGSVPMGNNTELPFWLAGSPKPASMGEMKFALTYFVQSDYLKVLGIPLKAGRFLTPEDNEHSRPVIVIDDQFARLYFGNVNPIGRQISFDIMSINAEIVGVVGHVKQWGLDTDASSPIQAQCYLSVLQIPDKQMPLAAGDAGLLVRAAGTSLPEVSLIRGALNEISGQFVLYDAQKMDGIISQSLTERRLSMILLAAFAALALVMSCIGMYGVVSQISSQRTHEIGIRMALGANRADVLFMLLSQAFKMVLIGVAGGVFATFGLPWLLGALLYGVSAHDPITLAGCILLLSLVALAACYFPARRAMRVDPVDALRHE